MYANEAEEFENEEELNNNILIYVTETKP